MILFWPVLKQRRLAETPEPPTSGRTVAPRCGAPRRGVRIQAPRRKADTRAGCGLPRSVTRARAPRAAALSRPARRRAANPTVTPDSSPVTIPAPCARQHRLRVELHPREAGPAQRVDLAGGRVPAQLDAVQGEFRGLRLVAARGEGVVEADGLGPPEQVDPLLRALVRLRLADQVQSQLGGEQFVTEADARAAGCRRARTSAAASPRKKRIFGSAASARVAGPGPSTTGPWWAEAAWCRPGSS